MQRSVEPEILDDLSETEPAAIRSRRDLRRVHSVMRTRAILIDALRRLMTPTERAEPLRVLELGAGDGSLMLGVARTLAPTWPRVDLTLLDRQRLIDPATIQRYAELGWTAREAVLDVRDWVAGGRRASDPAGGAWDLVVANLFLHHFEGESLSALLDTVSLRSPRFLACEPRRAWVALAGSHLVGALGANAVTRTDAVLSVQAGFCAQELTALWPRHAEEWVTQEYAAGLFSHCFVARRSWAR